MLHKLMTRPDLSPTHYVSRTELLLFPAKTLRAECLVGVLRVRGPGLVDSVEGDLRVTANSTRTEALAHSSTTSVPFIFRWPKPQTFEQRNWKVPALSAVNSMTTVVPFGTL